MITLANYDSTTEIQKFLNTHSSIMSGNNDMSEKFNIEVVTEMLDIAESDGMSELIFIYNRGEGKSNYEYIEDEANKLILSCNGDIINRTFRKVHDIKEYAHSKHIKWDTAEIESHLDGTHISIFKYNNVFFIRAWHKDSDINKSIEACVKDMLTSKHRVWFSPFDACDLGKSCCWTFEFVSPQFKNIVEYKEPKLYLLSMFNKKHSFECSRAFVDEFATKNGFSRLGRKRVNSISEINNTIDSMTALDKGLIITDADKCRAKVVNQLYKTVDDLTNFRNKPSINNLAKLVLLGHQSNIESTCGEYSVVIRLLELALESLLSEASTTFWSAMSEAESKKEFANIVVKRPVSSLLFEWYMRKSIHKDKDTLLKLVKPRYVVSKAKSKDPEVFAAALSDAEIDREYKIKNTISWSS